MIEKIAMENTKKETLTLYGATLKTSGEYWNFQLGTWVTGQCLQCFSVDPAVVGASWGQDDKEVVVHQFRLVQMDAFRSRKNDH
jgi:hypothetical protein